MTTSRSGPLRPVLRRVTVLCCAVLLVLVAAPPAPAAANPGPPPNSMASMGDSITRAFNACGFYVDCTSRSFSTGDYGSINSHYLRIRSINSAINGRNFNESRSGAKVNAMPGQATAVVARNVDYVTILIGANDACTSTEAGMTPVATFRAQIDQALATLKAGLPNARVLVISIPDIKRLWEVGRTSFSARTAWSLFSICQSMLANPQSFTQANMDRRDRVRQRVVDYNAQLAAACTAYGSNCRFDGNAVFNYPFTLSQLSGWDYFHPNNSGQTVLANVSYRAGFNW